MIRRCLPLVMLIVLGSAAARQPVSSPIYYLTTAPVLEDGVVVHGTLTPESGRNFKDGSHVDVLVVRGEAGAYLEIEARSTAFDTTLTLFAPDGSVVAFNDDDWRSHGTDAVIRTTLGATGTHVVVVSGFSPHDLGPYTVTMRRGVAGAEAGALRLPERVEGTIEVGGRAVYRLTVEEPVVLGAELSSPEFDTYLEVLTAEGWIVAENDDVWGGTDSALVVRLEPGTYQVVVSSYGGWGGGAFELDLAPYVRAR